MALVISPMVVPVVIIGVASYLFLRRWAWATASSR
jgi:ABC-type spermidine/putrescine transport system permease subunit II